MAEDGIFLKQAPFNQPENEHLRPASTYTSHSTFLLPKGSEKHYQQQYADMYFLRLANLKNPIADTASAAWSNFTIAGETAKRVDRVLDVRQGELCWVVGTVYMEMSLKPNILDDIAKEHWIAAPPARQKYITPEGGDQMMLEDESGRLRITGAYLGNSAHVTGCVMAALGTEQADGSFEVIDTRFADFPRQPQRWEGEEGELAVQGKRVKQKRGRAGKVAIVSGLEISGDAEGDVAVDLLFETLMGAASGLREDLGQVTRVIIAGGSLAHSSPIPSREEFAASKKGQRKYGYDASAYNAAPTERLDEWLSELLPTVSVTLMPGATDPAPVAIPQQPLHMALFPKSRSYMNPAQNAEPLGLDSVTNPWEGDVDGWRFLGTGGQTVTDVLKYLEEDDVMDTMEAMLRWRCIAPTAPDTLWSYPFQDDDPLIVRECPHVYLAGNQPRFETRVAEGPLKQHVSLIAVPKFRESKTFVILDMETLEAKEISVEVKGQ